MRRHGKYLLLPLDDGSELVLHLGMTGQLFLHGAHNPRLQTKATPKQTGFSPDQHTHLQLRFVDASPALIFRDVRKFGKVALTPNPNVTRRLSKLGVDALGVRDDDLWNAARKRRTPIKTLLLNQAVLAGVGNIYADEALFLAGIRPLRPASKLTRAECRRLAETVRTVLQTSIERGGSSIRDYVQPSGRDGGYQDQHMVYGREGETCRHCKASQILRIVIAQRSSHYCRSCQA